MIEPTLTRRVEQAAAAAVGRFQRLEPVDWFERLYTASQKADLPQRIERARSHRWAGAIPTSEPACLTQFAHAAPPETVGIDGSQIYPDDQSSVLWAYVQAVAYAKSRSPLFEYRFVDIGSELAAPGPHSAELHDNHASLAALTNVWRTLLEMHLARRASSEWMQSLVLLDNGLLPWLSVNGESAQEHLSAYHEDLSAMRPALIAGVICAPQSRLLWRLIALAEADSVEQGVGAAGGVLDQDILRGVLQVGQRSAIFRHGSPRNDRFLETGCGVHFFFVRTARLEIARVEIPAWVAKDSHSVEAVHAGVLSDAAMTGYSYVLSQAHQHVVVPLEIGTSLHQRADVLYWQQTGRGIRSKPAKAAMKERR